MKFFPKYYWVVIFLLLTACATYYQKNQELMNAVYSNNLTTALKLLDNDAKGEKPARNKLLFYLNKGSVLWLNKSYAESNAYFRKADYFIEDNYKSATDEVVTLLTNANYTTYLGESFEQVLLHYYSALNYLSVGQTEEALIEAKRMLSKLQRVTDTYKNNNKYKFDAFAHNLAGIVYEANGDINNAFIAYRNAYKIYKEDYSLKFGTPVPKQLKTDLMRAAKLNGFNDELLAYEKEFELKLEPTELAAGSDVVVFWNNGLGPVKDQNSINFTIIPYANHPGWVEIANWDLGISFPFNVGDSEQRKGLLDMKIIRLALPKYISRSPVYQRATLMFGDTVKGFDLAENVNAIAFKSLEDRMLAELGRGLLRVALKQLVAHQASKNKQDGLAFAAQLYGAISEQADTRNWQLLPHGIFYTRLKLPAGNQTLKFTAFGSNNNRLNQTVAVDVKARKTAFVSVQTMQFAGYGNN